MKPNDDFTKKNWEDLDIGVDFEKQQIRKRMEVQVPRLDPKEEYTRIKFEPGVRHNLSEIPNHIMYRAFDGAVP